MSQFDLATQRRAKRVERLFGVVSAAIEPMVDESLYAAPQRLEQRGNQQRRHHNHNGLRLRDAQRASVPRRHRQIDTCQNRRQQAIDQRPIDDDIDVEEAIAQDPDTSADGQHDDAKGKYNIAQRVLFRDKYKRRDNNGDHRDRAERKPFDLLTLDVTGLDIANDNGHYRCKRAENK